MPLHVSVPSTLSKDNTSPPLVASSSPPVSDSGSHSSATQRLLKLNPEQAGLRLGRSCDLPSGGDGTREETKRQR